MRQVENSSNGSVAASATTVELTDTILILMPFAEPEGLLDTIRKHFPKVKLFYHYIQGKSERELWMNDVDVGVPPEYYQQATILLTLRELPLPEQAPNLRLVHLFSAGINHIQMHPIYTSTDVTITTSSGIHGPQITEHIFLTILSSTHHLPRMLSWQKSHYWGDHSSYFSAVQDLVTQRIGILGYGSIGRQTARVAKAFGMSIHAYTASPRPTPESRADKGYIVPGTGDPLGELPDKWFSGMDKTSLHKFLGSGLDVLVIAVPLTADSHHLLSAEEFEILGRPRPHGAKGAYIVNVSRGGTINHDALIAGLKKGLDPECEEGIRGASLDVTDPEPLGKESELWELENVVITPHISGVGSSYKERCFEVFLMNLGRMGAGEEMVNVVNRKRGY
ncbi:hypothetical protein RUND412_003813 [Rhizina undulata]